MVIVFIVMLLGWFGALYFFLQERTLGRIFGLLLMSLLTYLSFELTLWSYNLPLPVMMVVGLIPISIVTYGFRVYDYNREQEKEKLKNDDKHKADEVVSA
ncbi:MAG: hypothetical protein WBC91_17055 [Phototrophicaceae bacterium]